MDDFQVDVLVVGAGNAAACAALAAREQGASVAMLEAASASLAQGGAFMPVLGIDGLDDPVGVMREEARV